jgi:arylsulfatase A-like enzyme
LEQSGILENTWLVLTTDHGEMFERGIIGHTTPVFYQPMIHIPLVIFPPGQESRVDVYDNTSAIDLLPTLCHLIGQEIPAWAEGIVVPPFSKDSNAHQRDISTIQVEMLDKKGDVSAATAMLLRDNLKLMWSFGYPELEEEDEIIELYDLAEDPEELSNLASERKSLVDEFLGILRAEVEKLERAYP